MIEKNIMGVICEISIWLILHKVDWIYCGWTDDYSLYYKMKINNCNIYLEIFFSKAGNTNVVSIFKGKKLIPFAGGTLESCLNEIEKICYGSWIKISDRFPEYYKPVTVKLKSGCIKKMWLASTIDHYIWTEYCAGFTSDMPVFYNEEIDSWLDV